MLSRMERAYLLNKISINSNYRRVIRHRIAKKVGVMEADIELAKTFGIIPYKSKEPDKPSAINVKDLFILKSPKSEIENKSFERHVSLFNHERKTLREMLGKSSNWPPPY